MRSIKVYIIARLIILEWLILKDEPKNEFVQIFVYKLLNFVHAQFFESSAISKLIFDMVKDKKGQNKTVHEVCQHITDVLNLVYEFDWICIINQGEELYFSHVGKSVSYQLDNGLYVHIIASNLD